MRVGRATGKPGAAHIDGHHAIPGLDIYLHHGLAAGVGDGGIVDQAIEASQRIGRCRNGALDRPRIGHVHRQVVRAQCVGEFRAALVQDVTQGDLCAGIDQCADKSLTQATRAAGDQHAVAGQTRRGNLHCAQPLSFTAMRPSTTRTG